MMWLLPADEAHEKLENLQREHALNDYSWLEGGVYSLTQHLLLIFRL